MKKTAKKLSINKETVTSFYNLSETEIRGVRGGIIFSDGAGNCGSGNTSNVGCGFSDTNGNCQSEQTDGCQSVQTDNCQSVQTKVFFI